MSLTREWLHERIAEDVDLQNVRDQARESILDKAEDNVFDDVEAGDSAMSKWLLGTLGRNRGYVERTETTGDSTVTVIIEDATERID